jgi:hypothetical protein
MSSAPGSTAPRTKVFVRDDGVPLRVVEGFRQRVRSAPKESVQPKADWSARDYETAAGKPEGMVTAAERELAR